MSDGRLRYHGARVITSPTHAAFFFAVLWCSSPAVHGAGTDARCIPFDSSNNQIALQARVNGHDAVWLTLDTGSQGSVLDERKAAALGLASAGRQQSLGAGGLQEGSTVHGVDVELAGFRLPDQTMDTLSLDALSAAGGRRMDGILGHQVFSRWVVAIDYPRSCLSLLEAADFATGGNGVVPIEIVEDHPYVTASVALPGGRSITGRFVIDTGSSSSLILSPEAIDGEGFEAAVGKTLHVQGQGVGGSVTMRLARAERFDLGGFSLARPIVVLQPAGAGRVSAPGTIGNIGGAILRRFKVTFDYAGRRMLLEPGPDFAMPFEGDMSGLTLVTPPPDFATLRVARVMEGSPAFEAGVQAGDEIESVDGTPAGATSLPALRERLRHEGKKVRLVLRRGTERITVTVSTRRLI